jgi:hypothetical protein
MNFGGATCGGRFSTSGRPAGVVGGMTFGGGVGPSGVGVGRGG